MASGGNPDIEIPTVLAGSFDSVWNFTLFSFLKYLFWISKSDY